MKQIIRFYQKVIIEPLMMLFDSLSLNANNISLLRTLLIIPIYAGLQGNDFFTAFWIYLTALYMDHLDGELARYQENKYIEVKKNNHDDQIGITDTGKIIDPTVDKLLIISLIIYFMNDFSSWVKVICFLLIISETISFLVALIKYLIGSGKITSLKIKAQNTGANNWGKIKMVTEGIAFAVILFFTPKNQIAFAFGQLLLFVSLTLSILSVKGHVKAIKIN